MLPFGVTIPATVPQRSEIPEGLMNYPVLLKRKKRETCTLIYLCPLEGKQYNADFIQFNDI